MNVKLALTVEGTDRIEILCYGILSKHTNHQAYEGLIRELEESGHNVYRLSEPDWPVDLLLCEIRIKAYELVAAAISEVFTRLMKVKTCYGTVCMFDGAFSHYDDLMSDNLSYQTFAFCVVDGDYAIVLDSDVLQTEEWRRTIASCSRRLKLNIGGP